MVEITYKKGYNKLLVCSCNDDALASEDAEPSYKYLGPFRLWHKFCEMPLEVTVESLGGSTVDSSCAVLSHSVTVGCSS
jgi:hypothetical protein